MKQILPVILIFALLITGACSGTTSETLTGEAKTAVLTYSEAMTENVLTGMNNADYSTFAHDFDDSMQKAMTPEEFQKLLSTVGKKLGTYKARTISNVEAVGEYTRVIYNATFANEDNVTVRVVFNKNTPDHKISGLWFDSAKLRQP